MFVTQCRQEATLFFCQHSSSPIFWRSIHNFIRSHPFKILARKCYPSYWEQLVQRVRKESGYSVMPKMLGHAWLVLWSLFSSPRAKSKLTSFS